MMLKYGERYTALCIINHFCIWHILHGRYGTLAEDQVFVCTNTRVEVVYAHIALDQTVVPSRSETDNEVDVHARRAITSRRSDAKISR